MPGNVSYESIAQLEHSRESGMTELSEPALWNHGDTSDPTAGHFFIYFFFFYVFPQ